MNQTQVTLDLFASWKFPWIVVSRHYLGSINHSLLTIDVLKSRGIDVLGWVFNGHENLQTESFISHYSQLPILGRIEEETQIEASVIERYSQIWKKEPFWKQLLH